MDSSRLDIYRASAGSGKTYTLAMEYIKLLFHSANPEAMPHQHILAVTFTNKATMEMKQRILSMLDDLRRGTNKDLAKKLCEENGISDDVVSARANEYYVYILHNYDKFQVSTIDTFFVQVVRSCAYELGMFDDYSIQIDADTLISQAVNEIYAGLDSKENSRLLKWLTGSLQNRLEREKPWNMRAEMLKIGHQLTQESYKEIMREDVMRGTEPFGFEDIDRYSGRLQRIVAGWEERLAAYASDALDILGRYGLDYSDFSGGKNSGLGVLQKFRKRNRKAMQDGIGKKFLEKAEDESKAVTSKMPQAERERILEAMRGGFQDALRRIADHYNTAPGTDYRTACALLENITMCGVLSTIERHYRDISNRQCQMVLENNGELIRRIIDNAHVPFIYEKIGTQLHHFMIDEFQDTSSLQWTNFRPLLLDGLAGGHSSVLVGDVKQSIYRWRNSNWHLMATEVPGDAELQHYKINFPKRNINYRSRSRIVEFNNKFFSDLNERYGELLENNYQNVAQEVSEGNANIAEGRVRMDFMITESKRNAAAGDDAVEESPMAIKWLMERIDDCRGRGAAWRSMAILVRQNKQAQQIAQALSESGIPITSQDALLVSDAPCVKFLVAVMRYLVRPAVEQGYGILIQYAVYVLKMSRLEAMDYAWEHRSEDITDLLLRQAGGFDDVYRLSMMSLTELVETLYHMFRLDEWDRTTSPHLQAFVDCVYETAPAVAQSVTQFLLWWDNNKDRTYLPLPDNDAISIITIHKAKGLDFPVVMIPYCRWETARSSDEILWVPTKDIPEPFNELKYVPISYSSAKDTHFDSRYQSERNEKFIDAVNELYVAFTRPKDELYALVELSAKQAANFSEPANVGQLLFGYCCSQELVDPKLKDSASVEQGSAVTFGAADAVSGDTAADTSYTPVDHAGALRNMYMLQTGQYRGLAFQPHLQGIPLADSDDDEVPDIASLPTDEHGNPWLNYGVLMHELLARITAYSETDSAIRHMQNRGRITGYEARILRGAMDRLLEIDGVKHWLSGQGRVLNEHTVIDCEGNNLRPDRVVITDDGRAVIIDYKFGTGVRDTHRRQVLRYMELYRQMGYEPEGYLIYGSVGKIIQVT